MNTNETAAIASLAAVSGFLGVTVIVILGILILTCYKYQMKKRQLQRFREEKATDAQPEEEEEETKRDVRDETREQTEVSWGGRGDVREELRVKFFEKVKEGGEGKREEFKSDSYTRLSQLNISGADGEQETINKDNPPSRGSFSTTSNGSNDYVNNEPGYENNERWVDEDHTLDQSLPDMQRPKMGFAFDDYVHMSSVHEPKRVTILSKFKTLTGQQQQRPAAGVGKPGHSMERSGMGHNKPYQEWAAKSNSRFKGPTVPPSVSRATAAVPYIAQEGSSGYKNVNITNLTALYTQHHSKLEGSSAEQYKIDTREHMREQEIVNMTDAPTTEGRGKKKRTYVNIDGSLLPPEPFIKPRQKQVK